MVMQMRAGFSTPRRDQRSARTARRCIRARFAMPIRDSSPGRPRPTIRGIRGGILTFSISQVLHPDGKPYRDAEVKLIRELTGRGKPTGPGSEVD